MSHIDDEDLDINEAIECKERLADYASVYGNWVYEITPEQARLEARRCRERIEGRELFPDALTYAAQSVQFEDIAHLITEIKRSDFEEYFHDQ